MSTNISTFKIFVGNLESSVESCVLQKYFERYGKVYQCDIISNYGFVHMESEAVGQDAIKNLNGLILNGQPIRVSNSTTSKGPNLLKIFVGNISEGTQPEDVINLFSKYGGVVKCDIIRDYAFVHMDNEESGKKVVDHLNGSVLNGNEIKVCAATSSKTPKLRKIFVGNLPENCNSEKLNDIFSKYGNVLSCDVISNSNYAFVHMDNDEAAKKAIDDLHGSKIDENVIKVSAATSQKGPQTKLFVGNLPVVLKAKELNDLFSKYGTVLECDVLGNYGFVHINSEDVSKCMEELNGHVCYGHRIRVRIADNKESLKDSRCFNRHNSMRFKKDRIDFRGKYDRQDRNREFFRPREYRHPFTSDFYDEPQQYAPREWSYQPKYGPRSNEVYKMNRGFPYPRHRMDRSPYPVMNHRFTDNCPVDGYNYDQEFYPRSNFF